MVDKEEKVTEAKEEKAQAAEAEAKATATKPAPEKRGKTKQAGEKVQAPAAKGKAGEKKPARKAKKDDATKKKDAKLRKKIAASPQEISVPKVEVLDEEQAGLNPDVFEVTPKVGLIHQVVRAEFASMRQGTAASKNRAEVRGGGKKPWRQKGTGRARAGSTRMPHWTGGGVVFGPTPRDYSFKINRKVRRQALRMALSTRAREGGFKVVESLSFKEPKTAAAAAVLESLQVAYPLLVLLTEADENAALSFRNIPRVEVTDTDDLLVSEIMAARTILATKEAVERLNRIGGSK
jgi:large subunit ribosomal protein L4